MVKNFSRQAGGLACLIALTALAAVVPAAASAATIDLQPVVDAGVQLVVGTASTILVGLVGVYVRGDRNEKLRVALIQGIDAAADYAVNSVPRLDWTKVETKNALVSLAAGYVIKRFPSTLAKFKIDQDSLAEMVLARLLKHDKAPGNWSGLPA